MGRPPKLTLDFFIHDAGARHDRKIRALRRRHGNDGYATFFCLLEMLCSEDGLQLDLSTSMELETTVEDCGLRDTAHFHKIIHTCVELGLFDRQLWESERIVFSFALHNRYVARLEERKQAAVRKKRQRDADKLQKRISDAESKVVTRDNPVTIELSQKCPSPELSELSELSEPQNLRTLELKNPLPEGGANAPVTVTSRQDISSEQSDWNIQPEPKGVVSLDDVSTERGSDATQIAPDEGKCSAAEKTPAKNKKGGKTSQIVPSLYEQFKQIFNERKPPIWAAIQSVGESRRKAIDKFIAQVDEDPLVAIGMALDYACRDRWASGADLTFENFFTNNKPFQYYEKAKAIQEVSGYGTALAFVGTEEIERQRRLREFQERQKVKNQGGF